MLMLRLILLGLRCDGRCGHGCGRIGSQLLLLWHLQLRLGVVVHGMVVLLRGDTRHDVGDSTITITITITITHKLTSDRHC